MNQVECNKKKQDYKSVVSLKRVLKILFLLCIIFVFCPTFLVSCSGKKIEVSAATAAKGISVYGEEMVEAHPIMWLCLMIPLLLFVLFFTRLKKKKICVISLLGMIADFIVWLVFKASIKTVALQNYCSFEVTGIFYANMTTIVLTIVLSGLVVSNRLDLETDILHVLRFRKKSEWMSFVAWLADSVVNGSSDATKKEIERKDTFYCIQCGAPLLLKSNFCTRCGIKVLESEEMSNVDRGGIEISGIEEKYIFCSKCGTKLTCDSVFCVCCGEKA